MQKSLEFQLVTPRPLSEFRGHTLILPDVRVISQDEAAYLRTYVDDGKTLLITGEDATQLGAAANITRFKKCRGRTITPQRRILRVDAVSELLSLPPEQKVARGLDHTPAEIAQQPDTWLSTDKLFHARRTEIKEFLSRSGVDTHSSSNVTIFLVGAGTSDYIGQPLAHLLRECWHSELLAIPSTDLLTHMDDLMILERKYFWISFSLSGDSPEAIAVLEQARKTHPDICHLVVSCNSNGRMFRDNADQTQVLAICLDDAVNDRGLAMTSAFSNMVIFGPCLAHIEHLGSYEEVLSRVVEAGRSLLPRAADCASRIAKAGYTQACFVGSGPLPAVARESALKLRELTAGKTMTTSESTLGLRHAPMAALDRDSLFIGFLSGDQRVQHYERNLLQEISKKRLARCRVVVTGDAFPGEDGLAQHYLHPARSSATGPCAIPDQFRPPVDVMFGQLLGLFSSLHWNLRPDCPSPSGAISRVAQSFNIYQ